MRSKANMPASMEDAHCTNKNLLHLHALLCICTPQPKDTSQKHPGHRTMSIGTPSIEANAVLNIHGAAGEKSTLQIRWCACSRLI